MHKFVVYILRCLCLIPFLLRGESSLSHKVYDCFLFFNEIDVLKVRLNELKDVVDYFVIVEATKTFSGIEKPSYYKMHEAEFEPFRNKIIHVLLKKNFCSIKNSDCYWKNEFYQRNQIVRGLETADDHDIVICSDVDEIPRKETVQYLRNLHSDSKNSMGLGVLYHLELDYFLFKFNNLVDCKWRASFVTAAKFIKQFTPQKLREGHHTLSRKVIPNAGWHFSWIGSPEDSLYKLKSFSHAKDSFVKSDDVMLDYFKNHLDLGFVGYAQSVKLVQIDNAFPEYLIENKNYYAEQNLIGLCD